MDITAFDGKFFVAAIRFGGAKYAWNKDGSLSISGKRDYPVMVQTSSGSFLECLDGDGNVISEGGDGAWYHIEPKPINQVLRFKILPKIKMTEEIAKKRKEVMRYLVDDSPYSLGVPSDLAGAIKWFTERLAEIPEASRAGATVDFSNSHSYGDSYSNIEISYSEPETDKELLRRLQIETERERLAKLKKLAQFEQLKTELAG